MVDDAANPNAVARHHLFVAKVRHWAEHIDAPRAVNQSELQSRGVIVPAMHDAAQLAADADRIRHTRNDILRVNRGDVVNRVLQVRRQDVDNQILNRPHHITRHNGQRQLDIFLELGLLVVNGGKRERSIVQQTDREREVLWQYRREIITGHGISTCDRDLHNSVLKRVRHLDVHLHTAPFRDVQFRSGETDLHVGRPAARGGVVADEIEGVLWVDVPLGLANGPIRRPHRNRRLPHERVLAHRPCPIVHCPRIPRIRTEFAHHIDQLIAVVQRNHIIAIEPSRLAHQIARLEQQGLSVRVHQDKHIVGLNGPFELLRICRLAGAVVPSLDAVGAQVDGHWRRIVEFDGFVVRVAFDVLADVNLLTEAAGGTIEDVHSQRRGRQAVTLEAGNILQRLACRQRGFIKSTERADPPNVVLPDAKLREIVLRVRGRVDDVAIGVGDAKHVLRLDCFGGVTEGDHGVVLADAADGRRCAAGVRDDAAVAGRGITSDADDLNGVVTV